MAAISVGKCCAGLLLLVMALPSLEARAAGSAIARAPQASAPGGVPHRSEVIAVLRRTASAQIAQAQAREAKGRSGAGAEWVSAVFFVGAMRLTEVTEAPDVLDYSLRAARRFHYAFQDDGAPIHVINADDTAIGDLYLKAYLRTGAPGMLLPLKARLDYTMPYLASRPASQRLVWWWCDALFMAPPVLARMSQISGDPRYLAAMDAQFWQVHERLYDRSEHLFARDERFRERRSARGRKVFWSRGEGWALAGLARVLETMPADFPSRPRYLQLYGEMAARILSLQQADGLWRTSLLDPDAIPGPETSGTALLTYALAFGINHGLLDRATYQPAVIKAWNGMNRFLLPGGLLGQVQSPGDQPGPARPGTTALYATGAFLLAGTEIAALAEAETTLPLPRPVTAPLRYEAANWQVPTPPPGAPPAVIAEYARGKAEREAVARLSFDPVQDDPAYRDPFR